MLWWLAENSVLAAALAGIVGLLCRLGRLRPAVRHALWLVVLIKLVTPPVVQWPWQLLDFAPFSQPEPVGLTESPSIPDAHFALPEESEAVWPPLQARREEEPIVAQKLEIESAPADPLVSDAVAPPWWQAPWLPSLAFSLWLAGSAGIVLLQIFRIVRFRRIVSLGQPAPRWLMRQVKARAAMLRLKEPLTLAVPRIRSPFVWSFGWPKLLWPDSLLGCLTRPSCRSIVVHELAHLRRRDHWVGWLLMLAECVWWWNPIFWYVRRQLRLNAELACDSWVISLLPEDRRAYAEALIQVSQLVSLTAAPAPALGMSSSARQVFERRLTMIMRDQVPCKVPLLGLVVIGLLGLAALPGWSQAPAKKNEPAKKQETKPVEKIFVEIEGKPVDVIYVEDLQPFIGVDFAHEGKDVKKAQPAADADRDKRLQLLEQQLQALLKEVQALRTGKPTHTEIRARRFEQALQGVDVKPVQVIAQPPQAVDVKPVQVIARLPQGKVHSLAVRLVKEGEGALALSRASYQLPHAKAETLAAFLRDYVKAQVIETKVEGDTLTVTTTPDAQKAIGGLIGVIQGKTTAALDVTKPLAKQGEEFKLSEIKLENFHPLSIELHKLQTDIELQKANEAPRKPKAKRAEPKK
jgi:beta-lactamase regulating signal transducer with metallopeptidase domain